MKKPSISRLKKKLWEACSLYIRTRDKHICFTCGKYIESKFGYHAGHYIPSSTCGLALRYDERNIHGQCYHCNINLGGFGAKYHINMLEKYGQKFVDELWKIKNRTITKWTEVDYIKKTKYYEEKLKSSREDMR